MEHEPGDDYVRKTATFIRTNEQRLAQSGFVRRKKATSLPPPSVFNPLGWVGLTEAAPTHNPVVLTVDTHRLFYILMRLEALDIDIGSLDVRVDNPSRPMSYINLGGADDKSETLSIASFRSSFSAVSKLSLGSAWWGRSEPPKVDTELKYIYSSFTKLPALSIHAPGPKSIIELVNDPPGNNAIPLDAFKNLQSLECLDVDPRALLGWDRLAESLRSLTIKRSGVEDPTNIFIDAVVDDQARREGIVSRSRARRIGHRTSHNFYGMPETVLEESEERTPTAEEPDQPSLHSPKLSSLKWAFLKHLCLADNALTFLPYEPLPYLTSLTHLDLSSNLLVEIPAGLSALHNLVYLNLSDNMIDSVLGVYTKLGQVLTLNLSHNRLDSLCGLERLLALERIDLRNNALDESAEVGRLAVLPHVAELWVAENPFVKVEDDYRVRCFDLFWREGKTIVLDGTLPSFYERRLLTLPPSQQMTSSRPPSAAYSPPTYAVNGSPHPPPIVATLFDPSPHLSPAPSLHTASSPSPGLPPAVGKPRRRKIKRIVELDGGDSSDHRGSEDSGVHASVATDGARAFLPPQDQVRDSLVAKSTSPRPTASVSAQPGTPPTPREATKSKSRHSRYHTEVLIPSLPIHPSSSPPNRTPSSNSNITPPAQTPSFARRSSTLSSSSARRARVSASMYEPLLPEGTISLNGDGAVGTSPGSQMQDADAFRARIEALRAEVGDSWLHVLSQSQFGSGQVAKG